jgi:hypothetical protein
MQHRTRPSLLGPLTIARAERAGRDVRVEYAGPVATMRLNAGDAKV